jgi:hypothetical protein
MKKVVLAFACVLAMVLPAAAQIPDIAGQWEVNVMTDDGPRPPMALVLKKDADKIVGTLFAPQGEIRVEAGLKQKAVTVWFTVPTEQGPISVTMNGTLDGDVIKGSLDYGGQGQADWSAKRTAAAPAGTAVPAAPADARIDLTGTWALAVETGAGSGAPTVTFKQDGEKLTGQYSGQFGAAPVTGSFKGSAVEFAVDLAVQGTPIHMVYSGTADKSSMKGSVKLGDTGEGTFSGKKQ